MGLVLMAFAVFGIIGAGFDIKCILFFVSYAIPCVLIIFSHLLCLVRARLDCLYRSDLYYLYSWVHLEWNSELLLSRG